MRLPKRLGAIVFDLDGVLVDSEPLHHGALQEVLAKHGVDVDFDRFRRDYSGLDDQTFFQRVWKEWNLPEADFDLTSLRNENHALQRCVSAGVQSFPGVLDLVQALVERIPLAICSGSRRAEIVSLLSNLSCPNIADCFRTIISRDDVPKPKPDPTGYEMAAERLGVPPVRCLAIEDTNTGIEAAREAGLCVLAVANTQPLDRLRGADWYVPSLLQCDWTSLMPSNRRDGGAP